MKQRRSPAGIVFLSLVLFSLCLYALPAFAQEGSPITAANAAHLDAVGSFGSEENTVMTTSIAFSPDNELVAACVVDGGIQLWNTRTGAIRLLIDEPCSQIAFSPDGTLLVTTDLLDVNIYDAASVSLVASYPGSAFTFSANGSLLATVSNDGRLTIYAAPPGSDDASLPPTSLPVQTVIPFEPTNTPAAVATAVPVIPTQSGPTCTLTTNGETNLRSGPGTSFDRTGLVVPNTAIQADGQARGTDGATWYHLTSNEWVRADLVREPPECSALPVVTP